MQFAIDTPDPKANIIRAYEPGRIQIEAAVYTQSIITTPYQAIQPWEPQANCELMPEHFHFIAQLPTYIILLGMGLHMQFPERTILTYLKQFSNGIEFMDTGAACRTYNVLVSEGRKVAAALLIA